MGLVSSLLWVHAGVTTALAGLIWVVQLVVYPGLREVGAADAWQRVHAAHTRRMAAAVAPLWAVQGLCVALLLLLLPSPTMLLAAALAGVTVLVTVTVSVPLHQSLATGYDDAAAVRLVRTNWWRTAAWSAGAVCSLVLAARGAS